MDKQTSSKWHFLLVLAVLLLACNSPSPSDPDDTAAPPSNDTGGSITYTYDGRVFRIAAQEGAAAEDISLALDSLSSGGGDDLLNISPDGDWLVLQSERFDLACDGWACLVVVAADLSVGEAVRADGQIIHPEGYSAIASGGRRVVYTASEGPHGLDLWSVSRRGDAWGTPVLLTADSPQEFNVQPALSDDGSKVVFMCGSEPYGGEGTAICEVGTEGSGFRVVLTPAAAPAGFPTTGGLHQPDYAPDGSIVFEADWGSEQIWRWAPGAAEPVLVTDAFDNDNSPCVLPDGRIVSLWLNRPEGNSAHEIKVMAADGSRFLILLPDLDVQDAGLGCGE